MYQCYKDKDKEVNGSLISIIVQIIVSVIVVFEVFCRKKRHEENNKDGNSDDDMVFSTLNHSEIHKLHTSILRI